MGLDFRTTLYARDELTASNAVVAAYARIAQLNAILSDYDSDSEISRLSRTSGSGKWQPVGPDLWRILVAAQQIAERSGGAFDLTVGPSVNLWRRARREHKLPSAELLDAMRERVGFRNLQLDFQHHAALLTRPDMRLDAGGIAKGYALDEALAVLRGRGLRRAMIHAGGDMIFGDPPPGERGWSVELPRYSGAAPTPIAELNNCALSTSGDLNQFVEIDGVRYSHIIDPHTGIGLTNRSVVYVIAPRGITSDSLSKPLSVLNAAAGLRLLSLYPHTSCQIITGIGSETTTVQSSDFARHLKKR